MKKIHKIKLLETLNEDKFNTMERDQMNKLMGGYSTSYYIYLETVTIPAPASGPMDPGDTHI